MNKLPLSSADTPTLTDKTAPFNSQNDGENQAMFLALGACPARAQTSLLKTSRNSCRRQSDTCNYVPLSGWKPGQLSQGRYIKRASAGPVSTGPPCSRACRHEDSLLSLHSIFHLYTPIRLLQPQRLSTGTGSRRLTRNREGRLQGVQAGRDGQLTMQMACGHQG